MYLLSFSIETCLFPAALCRDRLLDVSVWTPGWYKAAPGSSAGGIWWSRADLGLWERTTALQGTRDFDQHGVHWVHVWSLLGLCLPIMTSIFLSCSSDGRGLLCGDVWRCGDGRLQVECLTWTRQRQSVLEHHGRRNNSQQLQARPCAGGQRSVLAYAWKKKDRMKRNEIERLEWNKQRNIHMHIGRVCVYLSVRKLHPPLMSS